MELIEEKREIVLSPKSIKIENKMPLSAEISQSDKSPFADGYDYYGELERLSAIDENEQILHQDAFNLLAERALMLKTALHKKDFFLRNQYVSPNDIDLSDISVISRPHMAGRLRQQKRPDKISLHINRSAYVWFGRSNKNQKRSIGLLNTMINFSKYFVRQALNGNFYAEAALIQGEQDLLKLEATIQNATAQLMKVFEPYRKNGIEIEILASEEPRFVEILMNRYGAKFALILRAYDYYNRVYFTLQNKGLLNKQQLKQIDILSQKILDFCEEINNTVERLGMVQSITRRKVLENEKDIIEKLKQATESGLLPLLPLSVLTCESQPIITQIDYRDNLNAEEIEKLKQIAIENKLVISE